MRLLICGSRNWTDKRLILAAVLCIEEPIDMIIHGGAEGADTRAHIVGHELGLAILSVTPNWEKYGKAAGAIRNQRMIDEGKPDLVYAFKDGFDTQLKRGGTEDMIRRTIKAGLPWQLFSHDA